MERGHFDYDGFGTVLDGILFFHSGNRRSFWNPVKTKRGKSAGNLGDISRVVSEKTMK